MPCETRIDQFQQATLVEAEKTKLVGMLEAWHY